MWRVGKILPRKFVFVWTTGLGGARDYVTLAFDIKINYGDDFLWDWVEWIWTLQIIVYVGVCNTLIIF